MNAEVLQYVFYAGFAALGWWLRHKGILAPRPGTPAGPVTPGPIDQKPLLDLLKSLLDRLAQAQPASPAAPAGGTGHVINVPIEVAATPRVSS